MHEFVGDPVGEVACRMVSGLARIFRHFCLMHKSARGLSRHSPLLDALDVPSGGLRLVEIHIHVLHKSVMPT